MFSPVIALKRIAKLQFFPAKYHFSWLSVLWVRSSQCFRLLAYSFDRRRSCMDAWRRRSFRRIFSNPRPGCIFFFSKVCCPRWGVLQRHLLPTTKDEDTMRINWMLITWSFRVFTTLYSIFLNNSRCSWRFTLHSCIAGRQRDKLEGKGAKGNDAKVVWCISVWCLCQQLLHSMNCISSLGVFLVEGFQRMKGAQQAQKPNRNNEMKHGKTNMSNLNTSKNILL